MSLTTATTTARRDKLSLSIYDGGVHSDFTEWHDRLTSLLKSKGRRVRQVLFGKGPFKDVTYAISEDVDDIDDGDDLAMET